MINVNNILKESAPKELKEFVSSCVSVENLINKIEQDSSPVFSILQNMKVVGNEPLAARLLYRINPKDFENTEVKKVETTLRNQEMLNRKTDPNLSLREKGEPFFNAHMSILALESSHFLAMRNYIEFQTGKIEMETGLNPKISQLVVEYLYLSDEKRKEFVPTVDKTLLPQMAELSYFWKIEKLRGDCDDELCNSLAELSIKKEDIKDWLKSPFFPKLTMLMQFINRAVGEGDLKPVIEQMQTSEGAAQLAAKCTPEEIAAFGTLKTEFGKACQIPKGTFGKAEWEKTFPVTIKEVPPLPANINAILELEDPCEPGKKLNETCTLFLRPEKVILLEEGGEKELLLSFAGVKELAKKATNPEQRTKYTVLDSTTIQRINQMPVEKSGWVLMRKEVIPGSGNKSFKSQKQLLKGVFEVPGIMDVILLNIITYASEGKYLYTRKDTRCQNMFVSSFAPSGLKVTLDIYEDSPVTGLSGTWKF